MDKKRVVLLLAAVFAFGWVTMSLPQVGPGPVCPPSSSGCAR